MSSSTLTDLPATLTVQAAAEVLAGLKMSRGGNLRLPAWQPLER